MIKKGTTVRLRPSEKVWYDGGTAFVILTHAEVAVMREADIKAGRFMDDAGETILYPTISGVNDEKCGPIVVVKTRGVRWPSYSSRRPKWLCAGVSVNLNRIVIFGKEQVVEVPQG